MSDISGITLTEPPPRSIAGIASYRDQAALRAALQLELDLIPPATPAFVAASGISLSCLSPTRYLATADRPADLPARLATLSDLAAITDQSDLWHVFIISGPNAPEALSRLVPIDLSADKFPTGSLALTRAGHLDVRLWHIAAQTYEIAVSRSYAEDLRHDLMSLAKQ